MEVPASLVDSQLEGQATQIYGLGVLGSLGVALLLAFVWASMVSRSHRATARHFQHLYTVIRQQKLMLDSINASLQAGSCWWTARAVCRSAIRHFARSLPETKRTWLTRPGRRAAAKGRI